jgi:Peptidase_C39 like family
MHPVGKSGSVKKLAGAVKKSQLSPRSTSTSTIAALAAAGSPVGCGNPLTKFKGQAQGQTNWCWAAVAASIADYYDNKPFVDQCKVVNATLSLPTGVDCCNTPGSTDCNKTVGDMAVPLLNTGNWKASDPVWLRKLPPMSAVVKEIDNCRPIAMSINWLSGPGTGNGHGLAIIGYVKDPSGDQLIIWDPGKSFPGEPPYSGGQKTVVYSAFSTSYNGQTISIDNCVGTVHQ